MASCYYAGSVHLRSEGRLAPAREQLKRAAQLTPKNPKVQAELSALYRFLGRMDLAEQHAQASIAAAESQVDKCLGYLEMGYLQQASGGVGFCNTVVPKSA